MKPKKHQVRSNDNTLMVYEWPGEGPPILLVHATGFHSRVWDQIIKLLPGKHIVAFDFMGHGVSDLSGLPKSLNEFTVNVIHVVTELDLKNVLGVGHSMGGYCVASAAAQLTDRFSALLLLDPIIFNPDFDVSFVKMPPEAFPVARRRNQFLNADEMIELLKTKSNFALWDVLVLRDYCQYGLKKVKDSEGYQLACDPLFESATYLSGLKFIEIYDQLKNIKIPVEVVRAQLPKPDEMLFSFRSSLTNPNLAGLLKYGHDIHLSKMSHFIPMEDPQLTAEMILDLYKRIIVQKAS